MASGRGTQQNLLDHGSDGSIFLTTEEIFDSLMKACFLTSWVGFEYSRPTHSETGCNNKHWQSAAGVTVLLWGEVLISRCYFIDQHFVCATFYAMSILQSDSWWCESCGDLMNRQWSYWESLCLSCGFYSWQQQRHWHKVGAVFFVLQIVACTIVHCTHCTLL